jgi:hypothetical protein
MASRPEEPGLWQSSDLQDLEEAESQAEGGTVPLALPIVPLLETLSLRVYPIGWSHVMPEFG